MKTTFELTYDKENDEHIVKVFEDGKENENRNYYTDDRQDAIETLKAMREEEIKKRSEISDEKNPIYIFQLTDSKLLVNALKGNIDLNELAKI